MESGTWISELYREVVESGDLRTNQWPLVPSPLPTIGFIVLYGSMSIAGAVFIKLKTPLPVQPLIVAYDLSVALATGYLFQEFLKCAYLASYNVICEPVDVTDAPLPLRIATAFWYMYLLRFALALDTVFLILRRKSNEIPLVQVVHHVSVPTASWILVKYSPGGQIFVHGVLNSAVYFFVYLYKAAFCYSSTRKYALALKDYVYIVHVVELSVTACHSMLGLFQGCFTPSWVLVATAIYCTVIILFVTVGKSMTLTKLLNEYWPRWLCGSWVIVQKKKNHLPKRSCFG